MSTCLRCALGAWILAGTTAANEVIPTNGMVITESTVFKPGVYALPDGISIGASDIMLDMNGATLAGTNYFNYGVTCIGHDNVTIRNGNCTQYYYGMRIEAGSGLRILDCDLSGNWVDPRSQTPSAPFLNINVGPNLGDRTNLGGGLFLNAVSAATVARCKLLDQENGMDLYFVTDSTITDNDASCNTGWGIHLYESSRNLVARNTADHCIRPGLGDSAGCLVVYSSHENRFIDNSFRYGGDGFFIGNEHGCPSNDNLIERCDGSFAGANAFEATFSSGNQFSDNTASGSNYGFWLGYSHSGNIIRGNVIRANNTNGIEIEHGQHNVIERNEIIGNGGKGIVLRTDGVVHFPPSQYPCLNLPNQAASEFYTIRDNVIHSNFGLALELTRTTDSLITNNLIAGNLGGGTAISGGANNTWSLEPVAGENIVGGPYLGGNYWSNYAGEDLNGDGLGDTNVPYTNDGRIALPGDPHPLIGDPPIQGFDNPRSLCDWAWRDLGRNTRQGGGTFNTSNGTHYGTDGGDLYLLESANTNRLSYFNPDTREYESRAGLPATVWDGGDLQYGNGTYFATIGVFFDQNNGSGKGSYLHGYDPIGNSWATLARTAWNGKYYATEALAFDPVSNLLYATIVNYQFGGEPGYLECLGIYDPALDAWTGLTSAGPEICNAGSEAEYLGGKIYVYPGGLVAGAVNGSDSYLNVYDIASDTWSVTPALQNFGIIPGFRSGAFDIWGVSLTSDPDRGLLFVLGGEGNRTVYIYDALGATWSTGATAVYDGGWGAALEYVPGQLALYQIDGRNSLIAPQGTAMMFTAPGDVDLDGGVDEDDFEAYQACSSGPDGGTEPDCFLLDLECDDDVDLGDFVEFQRIFSGS